MIALVAVAGGLHLPVLQVVAWGGMLVSNTGEHGLAEGVTRTFDGQHPCCLCDFVASAEAADEETPEHTTLESLSFKLLMAQRVILLPPVGARCELVPMHSRRPSRAEQPGVPPPRLA